MQTIISIIMALFMFFGTGTMRERALSFKYQDGSWSGSSIGIPEAKVENGLLYIDGEPADYPADSSVSYYVKPVVTTSRGTWFLEKSDTNSIYMLRLDYRGFNIKTHNLSELTFGAESVKTIPHDDTQEIEIEVRFPASEHKGIISYFICYDPDDQPKPVCE